MGRILTDRLYLRAYLQKYIDDLADPSRQEKLQRLKEDFDYSFVEYQGLNLVHWEFSEDGSPVEDLSMIKLFL